MAKHTFLAFLLLCCISLTLTAQEFVIEDAEGPSITCQGDIRDLMYADRTADGPLKARQFVNTDGEVINYRDRIANMPQYLLDFIAQYAAAGQAVLNGSSNWLSNPALGQSSSGHYYYLLKEVKGSASFTFPAYSSTDVIKQAASDAYADRVNEEYDILASFLPYAFLSVNYDYPEFFWIGNGYQFGTSSGASISYDPRGSGVANYTISLMFYLNSGNFDIRTGGVSGYNFSNQTDLASGLQRYHNSLQTILGQCPANGSRYDKLLAAHDWLTLHNCYNYFYYDYGYSQDVIGDTPWSAFSALEGNSNQTAPVCEGYSRAFKVLCDELDIPCILMSGNVIDNNGNTGGHMWNYVQMEDGKWYAVDVTWDDPSTQYAQGVVSGYESHDWFLLGSGSDIGDGMTLIESHPEQWFNSYPSSGSYSWSLRPGPELSPIAYSAGGGFDPCDINQDGVVDEEDVRLMAEAIADGTDDVPDLDGNGRISVGDLVYVIDRFLSN